MLNSFRPLDSLSVECLTAEREFVGSTLRSPSNTQGSNITEKQAPALPPSHVFSGARISSLPTNACSTENVPSKFWKVDLVRRVTR